MTYPADCGLWILHVTAILWTFTQKIIFYHSFIILFLFSSLFHYIFPIDKETLIYLLNYLTPGTLSSTLKYKNKYLLKEWLQIYSIKWSDFHLLTITTLKKILVHPQTQEKISFFPNCFMRKNFPFSLKMYQILQWK